MSATLCDEALAREVLRRAHRVLARRSRVVLAMLALLVVAAFGVDVLLGSFPVTIPDFVRIVTGTDIPGAGFVVLQDKLPRAVTGVMVGAAFGVSGAVFQTMLGNPLASPDIIGLSSGASFSAVLAIVVFGVSGPAVSVWALAGAGAVALVVYLTARRGGVTGARLILVGIAVAAVLQAAISYVMTRANVFVAADAFVWLNGSLNNSDWDRVRDLAVELAVLLPAVALVTRALHVLALGDDTATGLGVRTGRSRGALLAVGVALSAVGTAAAGPVAFVAFLSGPIARRLLAGRVSLMGAGLVGALIVLAADFAAREAIPGVRLPVGVVTGALGAPFLVYLLIAGNRAGRGGA